MKLKTLAIDLEDWSRKNGKNGGWKKIVPLITENHHGDLLQPLAGITSPDEYARRLHNNTQIIQRAFRNDTPNYRRHAAELAPAVIAAMNAEQAEQGDTHTRAAIANRECIEATCAVLTGKSLAVIRQETFEAIDALARMIGISVQYGKRAA